MELSIFIVEDDPLLLQVAEHMIVGLGHRVCGSAASVDEAIKGIETLSPQLVLVDIQLDGKLTGINLGAYINRHFEIPFIYQSSVEDIEMMAVAIATNPYGYLRKPFNSLELFMAIGIALNKRPRKPHLIPD